jgi:hypothetical protein
MRLTANEELFMHLCLCQLDLERQSILIKTRQSSVCKQLCL